MVKSVIHLCKFPQSNKVTIYCVLLALKVEIWQKCIEQFR